MQFSFLHYATFFGNWETEYSTFLNFYVTKVNWQFWYCWVFKILMLRQSSEKVSFWNLNHFLVCSINYSFPDIFILLMNRERTWIFSTNQLLSLKENSIWESLRVSYTYICKVLSQKSPNSPLVSWVLTACHKMPDSTLIYKPFLNGCSLVLWGGEPMKCPAGELGQHPLIHTEDSSRINTRKAENMLQGSMCPEHREGAKRSRNIPELRLTTNEGQEGPRWGFSPQTAHQNHSESFWKRDAQDQLNQNLCKMEPRHLTLFFKNTLGDSNAQWGWITTGLESWPLVLCDALDKVIRQPPSSHLRSS